jgi:hypothetical protein
MSANNEVLVKRKQNGKYKITDRDIDGDGEGVLIQDDIDGLENAIEVANKYLSENMVEYGLNIPTNA